ncbi:MAG: hypothetical protein QMD06_00775 [Candidatus Altarchaeum sp.]|nr:hypothetical protein [Candidatus Altarchaeum sp.]
MKVKNGVQYKGDSINILVDGQNTEWANVTRSKTDDISELKCQGWASGSNANGYDVKRIKITYNESSNKIYFLIETNEKPGDSDGNGNPDTGGNCMCQEFCGDNYGIGSDKTIE